MTDLGKRLEDHALWLKSLGKEGAQFKDILMPDGTFEADLRGANLRGADLRGANLEEARFKNTVMPDGSMRHD